MFKVAESVFFHLLFLIGDIVKYLFKHYGKGRSPSTGILERYSTTKFSLLMMHIKYLYKDVNCLHLLLLNKVYVETQPVLVFCAWVVIYFFNGALYIDIDLN